MRKGRFELSHGGTIFLDEVGDLPPMVQIRLLRVLQEREFERVGGTQTMKVDVRVIAATNRNLETLMEKGKFREDLYYRLNVFPIYVPPLRERKSDVLLLADFFVERYAAANNKRIQRICTHAIDMLMSYHWPGNVRELENSIERAVLLSNEGVIYGYHLPPTLQTSSYSGTIQYGTLQGEVDRYERDLIMDALKTSRGNMSKAAKILNTSERIIGLRVQKYNIDSKRFRT
jgi:Nif-specific regulatory protein